MKRLFLLAILAAAFLPVSGCQKDPADVPAEPKTEAEAERDPLEGLSAEDRAAVLAQKICPVTGEALGSMGLPIKLTVEGREVFICCEGCEAPLRDEPEKYFAILDKATGADADADAESEPAAAEDSEEAAAETSDAGAEAEAAEEAAPAEPAAAEPAATEPAEEAPAGN